MKVLLRGRRWGKTVLGDAWLAFLSGEAHLFKGTAVETKMRKDKLIGVKLYFSRAKVLGGLMVEFKRAVSSGLERATQLDPTFSYSPLKILYPRDAQGNLIPSDLWTIQQCNRIFAEICRRMNDIARSSSKKFTLFIDEYDSFVIKALQDQTNSDNYLTMNDFFGGVFTKLKSLTRTIPFQFITGSSRLAIRGFWSGPNNIVDLSSSPLQQPRWAIRGKKLNKYILFNLKGCKRFMVSLVLNCKTDWYDPHRWSSSSSDHVFNTWSIHQFMNSGKFMPYWASTGSSSRMLDSKLLLKSLVSSVMHDEVITIQPKSLTDSRLPHNRGESLSDEAQKALLVGAGILAIDPNYAQTSQSTPISLVIPNLDARVAIRKIFQGAISIPQSFDLSRAQQYIDQNDIIGLINYMIETNALHETLSFFSP